MPYTDPELQELAGLKNKIRPKKGADTAPRIGGRKFIS